MGQAGQDRADGGDRRAGRRRSKRLARVDIILIDRLLHHYDPWSILEISRHKYQIGIWRARADFVEKVDDRTSRYHYGRILHFVNQLEAGVELDPITIDNNTGRMCIYPEPIVIDGHHRLCSTEVAGRKTIRAHYSGRVDVLNYLTGKRKTMPES